MYSTEPHESGDIHKDHDVERGQTYLPNGLTERNMFLHTLVDKDSPRNKDGMNRLQQSGGQRQHEYDFSDHSTITSYDESTCRSPPVFIGLPGMGLGERERYDEYMRQTRYVEDVRKSRQKHEYGEEEDLYKTDARVKLWVACVVLVVCAAILVGIGVILLQKSNDSGEVETTGYNGFATLPPLSTATGRPSDLATEFPSPSPSFMVPVLDETTFEPKVPTAPARFFDDTASPSLSPVQLSSAAPSLAASAPPSQDSVAATDAPSFEPTLENTQSEEAEEATDEPTIQPTPEPTLEPTVEPNVRPTEMPSSSPSRGISTEPTTSPTAQPTEQPTIQPTSGPTYQPSLKPTEDDTDQPTPGPTVVTERPIQPPVAPPIQNPFSQVDDEQPRNNSPTGAPFVSPIIVTAKPTINNEPDAPISIEDPTSGSEQTDELLEEEPPCVDGSRWFWYSGRMRNCSWLRSDPDVQDKLCAPSHIAASRCPETCNQCP